MTIHHFCTRKIGGQSFINLISRILGKRNFMRSLYLTLLVLFASVNIHAQNPKSLTRSFEFGVYGGLNYNFHSPDFKTDANGTYKNSASSMGFHFGGFADYDLSDMFRLTGRLGIHGMGADLVEDLGNNTQNTLTSSITMLEFSPGVKINGLFSDSPGYLIAGFEYGSRLTSEYSENFGGADSSTTYSSIPGTNDRLAVFIGAGIPMKAWSYTITPEITYRKAIGNFSSQLSPWTIDQLRIGVSITLGPAKASKPKAPIPTENTIMEVGYYNDGGDYRVLENGLKVEDIQYSEMYPFIPFIFFGQNSDKPDPALQFSSRGDARGEFSLETLPQDAIEINKRTMDIVGLRMLNNAEATLSLVGSIDGKSESKNKGLAMRRAQHVKDYLTKNYSINESRIETSSRVLPDIPTAINQKDGMSENRRVTMRSSHADILEPIAIRGDETRWTKPELLEFRPKNLDSSSVNSWTLNITQADRSLRELVGVGTPTPQRWVIRPNDLSSAQVPIDYTLSMTKNDGKVSNVTGSIPIDYMSSVMPSVEQSKDMTVTKFSLILFDFDKSEISGENAEILKKKVGPVIKGNSTVKIYGYTDRIGAPDYNRSLALNRANAVRTILESISPDNRYEVFGRGEDVEIFTNENATGRVLSRTVQIFVETPRN
jgi:outer membrane protein OmpA-like peptidoglycan-associated protein